MAAKALPGKSFDGEKVAVHYNLHRCRVGSAPKKGEACFVVRQKGRVAGYVPSIALEDATFVVQPGGLKSIRKKGSRAVIAYAKGTGRDPEAKDVKKKIAAGKAVPVCFNPFKNDTFVNCETGKPVKEAKVALFKGRSAQATTLGRNDEPVVFPRDMALKIAEYERDSLEARAQTSSSCSRKWSRAAAQAQKVVASLEDGRDGRAARAALKVGPAWKKAADCEGWPTPPDLDGPINENLFDRYTLAHYAVGTVMGMLDFEWWQAALFAVGWEIVETPLKRTYPGAFPYSSEDSIANAAGDVLGMMLGWATVRMLRKL